MVDYPGPGFQVAACCKCRVLRLGYISDFALRPGDLQYCISLWRRDEIHIRIIIIECQGEASENKDRGQGRDQKRVLARDKAPGEATRWPAGAIASIGTDDEPSIVGRPTSGDGRWQREVG